MHNIATCPNVAQLVVRLVVKPASPQQIAASGVLALTEHTDYIIEHLNDKKH